MSRQNLPDTHMNGPVAPQRYGKIAVTVAALLLPVCAGVGYWIGSKSEPPRKASSRDVSVASASKPTRTERPSAPTVTTPVPPVQPPVEPVPPKKAETPKPPEKKKEPAPVEPPEPKPEPKPETPKPPEKKPEAKPPEPPKPKTVTPEKKPESAPTFASVMPIFQAKCVSCHSPASKKGGLDLATLAALMKGGSNGKEIVPGDLENSNLWGQVENDSMPPDGKAKLTAAEKKRIQEWILAGAK